MNQLNTKGRASLVFLCLILFTFTSMSAQRTVRGTISAASDQTVLPGATIQVDGTARGVVSDLDGRYEINLGEEDQVLVFSFVGYLTQRIPVDDRTEIDVALEADIMDMEEVVVTAYSEKSKTEISSAVVSLKADEINQVTVNSVADMLAGKVAGVQVQSASGQPGSAAQMRIRGVGSVFSPQSPLIVVDGIIGGTYNPNDIESISVLKDAGATGLYGSAAASGVVLITTRSGQAGQSEIRAKVSTGIKLPEFGNYSMMNSNDLFYYHKSLYNPAIFRIARPDSLLNYDFDWVNNSYRQSQLTSANVSASGANEKTNYYLSVDYMDDEGTLRGTDFQRLSVRSNIRHQLTKRLNIATNISFNHSKSAYAHWNMAEGVFRAQSWDSPYDANGEIIYDVAEANWLSNLTANPYHSEQYNSIGGYQVDGLANFKVIYQITDWLKFDSWTTFSGGFGKSEQIYSPMTYEGASTSGAISNSVYINQSIGNTSLLKFNRTFGQHGVDGLVGMEVSSYRSEFDFGGSATGILHGQEILGVAGSQEKPTGNKVEETGLSMLSQLNYNFQKKYFLTLAFRRDGSSKFSPRNKYANFFTYAASWLVSNEEFIRNIEQIHYLKLRTSYGAVGNSTFPSSSLYPYFPAFASEGVYNGQSSYFPKEPGNYNLTWETSYPFNLGLDLGLLNRIEINFDYYNSRTKDLLFQNPMPASQGYLFQWSNIGDIRNKGVEVGINAVAIQTSDLSVSFNFNFAANKNELLALSDKEGVDAIPIQRNGDATQILTVGGGAFDWYMPKWLGVDPATGDPLWEDILYDEAGNEIGREPTNNYTLAAQDPQIMGSPFPDFSGGFGTLVSYKGISLSAAFAYSYGNEIYHSNRQEVDNDGENISVNAMNLMEDWSRWSQPGDEATHPKPKFGGNLNSNKYSSRYLEDGSYLRIRNITLAYELPPDIVGKLRLKSCRIHLAVDNLKTWTNYSGMDPDVQLYLSDWLLPGTQFFKYPISKQFLVGLEISF